MRNRSLAAFLLTAACCLAQPPGGGKPARPLRERLLERALKGDADAQFDLGKNYETGRIGLPKDFTQAEHWYREAANQGEPFAQASLGILYGFGKGGVKQDLVQAYMWYLLAAAGTTGGDQVSVAEMRDDLALKLTPAQLSEAKKLAAAWKPKVSAATLETEVLAAMDAYRNAMISRDDAALGKLLAPDLAYVHSGGEFQTKADVISSIMKGASPIERMDFSNTTVRLYGGDQSVALVRAKVDLWHSSTNIVHMNVLHVWTKTPAGWQLVSRQATKLAE